VRWKEWAVNLYEKCQDAERQHPGLALDLIQLYPVREMSNRDLKSVIKQHVGDPPDVDFEFVEDDLIARFYGTLSGYSEFHSIGQEIYAWLRATDPQLPAKRSYLGWLKALYHITMRCPPIGFEVASNPTLLNFDVVSDPTTTKTLPADLDILYAVARYTHSPFELSSSALQMFIEPYQTRFLGNYSSRVHLVPWQLRCVFANPRIARLEPEVIVASGLKDAITVISTNDPFYRPRFFPGPNFSGKLYLAGHMVRLIDAGSTAIYTVLQAFEENDWPEQMDTPKSLGVDFEHAARDVVKKLNKRQQGQLQIHFDDVNSGRKISWEVVTEP